MDAKTTVSPNQQRLAQFLASPERPTGIFSYQQVEGFLFAIHSSPSLLPSSSEWMPVVFAHQMPGFADAEQEAAVHAALEELASSIGRQVKRKEVALPPDCRALEPALRNFDPESGLHKWSCGFLVGYDFIREQFEEVVPEARKADLDSYIVVLTFFAERELALALWQKSQSEQSFEQMAQSVVMLLDPAVLAYSQMLS